MPTAKFNDSFVFAVFLSSSSLPTVFVANPTIAEGDFQISKDFGPFVNLTNIPTVSPAGSDQVRVSLTALEMNADVVVVRAIDVAGGEWDEFVRDLSVPIANDEDLELIRKLLQNKQLVNVATNQMEVYDDNGGSVELSGDIWKDDGVAPWDGAGPIVRRDKLD